jgi:hypothetical protein
MFFTLQRIVQDYGIYSVSSSGQKSYNSMQDVQKKRTMLSKTNTWFAFRIVDSDAPYFAKLKSLIFDLTRVTDVAQEIPLLVNAATVKSFLRHIIQQASSELGQVVLGEARWQNLADYFNAGLSARITGEYQYLTIVRVQLKPDPGMQTPPMEQYELHHR